ncbi:hypothetical protein L7F22_027359 [Adiantum nelumboides]|nr:hypothetical protein [Adiantum nelumboides]
MKSLARGLPRHKTEKGTISDSNLNFKIKPLELATRSNPSKVEVKVKVVTGTLECVASNSKQSTKSSKALEYLRLTKFCFLAEELHEEYGLSLEGLPKELSEKDIPNEEWLGVFKCLHKKSTKLFLNHVRDEFVDKCQLLYQKVYQAIPSNGELLAKFAWGFVYERCPAAASDPIGHQIAWPSFGGSVLEYCKMQKGGLERKINKFHTDYGLTCVIQIEASICDGALSSIPTMSASKLQPFQAVEMPMYIQLVLSMADGLSGQENEQKKLLGEVKVQLQEKRDLWLRNKGHFSTYIDFYKELDQLNKKLEVLKASPDSDPREVDRKEIEVKAITKILSKAETNADKSPHLPELDKNNTELLELDKNNIELSEGLQHGKVVVESGDRVEDPEAKPFVVENHGNETIGQDSSKPSTDNKEGSLETADKVEDAEDLETLLIIANTLRKKRKRQ